MDVQPLTVLLSLFGGLILAGLLGWIRRPRLVVFVPRLFSHSRISDKGHIAEISVMNRGFKTEENVELSLSPSLQYELIGSNNPDASLLASKLLIPRIGSADDCSVLLQIENGKFTHADIVNCLSKETKATVATKLEEVPVTANQRVGILMFFGFIAFLALMIAKGVDYISSEAGVPATPSSTASDGLNVSTQGWGVGRAYAREDNVLYQALISGQLLVSTGNVATDGDTATVPVEIENNFSMPVTFRVELVSSAEQEPLSYSDRTFSGALVFEGESISRTLKVVVPPAPRQRRIIIEFFAESTDGETLSGRKLVSVGEP